MRHRPTAFGHIFAGDGYSAGYYVYIWADVMSPTYAGGVRRGRQLLRQGDVQALRDDHHERRQLDAPEVAFRNFRGRDADTNALMRDRGFPVT
jgi:peptidyl-dipeptidase Dcp